MLSVSELTYQYHQVQFSFDLEVARGEIVALIGPSGAGKSTLLSLIAGFIAPEGGQLLVDKRSILNLAPAQRPFSMLFQEHNLFAHLSVRENIALGLHPGLKLNSAENERLVQAARRVGIGGLLARKPDELSGGQRQRVALARCFVQDKPIWLLDEPFSALDPVLRAEMLSLVKQLANEQQKSVVMVTHHMRDAQMIADSFAFVLNNQVWQRQAIAALTTNHPDAELAAFMLAAGE